MKGVCQSEKHGATSLSVPGFPKLVGIGMGEQKEHLAIPLILCAARVVTEQNLFPPSVDAQMHQQRFLAPSPLPFLPPFCHASTKRDLGSNL